MDYFRSIDPWCFLGDWGPELVAEIFRERISTGTIVVVSILSIWLYIVLGSSDGIISFKYYMKYLLIRNLLKIEYFKI
jgi:hypothetical protein